MVEFVLLGAPAVLLFTAGVTMFINSYQDTVTRAIAIDASRYAALADQQVESARSYLNDKLKRLLPRLDAKTSLQIAETALVEISYAPLPTIFNPSANPITIRVVTPVETN